MDSSEVLSFGQAQESIKKEFLSFLSSIQSISTHPVSREVHNTYLKTIKSSFLLTTGLSNQINVLSDSLKREMDVVAQREATHVNQEVHFASQIKILNNRVFGLEKDIKALGDNVDQRLSYTTDRINDLLSSNSTILKHLQSAIFKLDSPPPVACLISIVMSLLSASL